MSVDAPERIWASRCRPSEPTHGYWYAEDKSHVSIEYVRVDKLEELAAALRVAQGNTDAAIEDYNEAKAALAEKDKEIAALREALEDAMAGMRYVRQVYGDLSGVGFNRVEERGRKALTRNAGGKDVP